jgi:hypothetical protein
VLEASHSYLADRKRVGCRPSGRDTPVSKLLSSGEMSLRCPYYHWWQISFHQLVSYGKNYTPISHYLGQDIKLWLYTYYGCIVFLFPNGLCHNVQKGLKNQIWSTWMFYPAAAASSPRRGATGAMTRMLPNPWHKEAIHGTGRISAPAVQLQWKATGPASIRSHHKIMLVLRHIQYPLVI